MYKPNKNIYNKQKTLKNMVYSKFWIINAYWISFNNSFKLP